MKKTADEISSQVLQKLLEEDKARSDTESFSDTPTRNKVLKILGGTGGGLLGGLFGGAAGSGLGTAIREFPGYKPKAAITRALSRGLQNPVGRGIATTLPFVGFGAGVFTGGRKGSKLFDAGGDPWNEEDVQRIIDAYDAKMS